MPESRAEAGREDAAPAAVADASVDASLDEVLAGFGRDPPAGGEASLLIPALQAVQEKVGYLPPESFEKVAAHFNVPAARVYGVATFYAQFYLTRQGRHKIRVCRGTACHVRGSGRIQSAVEKRLGIAPGQTTPDYEFSLERVACFGSCALAPVVVLDGKVHGRMTPEKTMKLVEDLK